MLLSDCNGYRVEYIYKAVLREEIEDFSLSLSGLLDTLLRHLLRHEMKGS